MNLDQSFQDEEMGIGYDNQNILDHSLEVINESLNESTYSIKGKIILLLL